MIPSEPQVPAYRNDGVRRRPTTSVPGPGAISFDDAGHARPGCFHADTGYRPIPGVLDGQTGYFATLQGLRASEAGSAHADRWRGMSRSLTTLNQDSTLIVVIEMIELACRKDGA